MKKKGGRKVTRDEIFKASLVQVRELVAVHVMGWEKRYSPDPSIWAWRLPDGGGCTEETWNLGIVGNWIENMAHAWEVLEKVTEPAPPVGDNELPPNTKFMILWEGGHVWAMDAKEAAETICKWALLAVAEPTA